MNKKIYYDINDVIFNKSFFEVKPRYLPAGSYILRIGDKECGYFIDE